jgi:hypothetical protein
MATRIVVLRGGEWGEVVRNALGSAPIEQLPGLHHVTLGACRVRGARASTR